MLQYPRAILQPVCLGTTIANPSKTKQTTNKIPTSFCSFYKIALSLKIISIKIRENMEENVTHLRALVKTRKLVVSNLEKNTRIAGRVGRRTPLAGISSAPWRTSSRVLPEGSPSKPEDLASMASS